MATILLLASGFECKVPDAAKCSKRALGLCSAFYYEGIVHRNTRGACNFLGFPQVAKAEVKKVNPLKASKKAATGK
jgi:hypothetical protein